MTTDTAQKYKDVLDPEHQVSMDLTFGCYQTLKMIEPHLRAVQEAERNSHSHMHITDPTLYRDMINSKSFASQIKIINAALAFVSALDSVYQPEKARLQ